MKIVAIGGGKIRGHKTLRLDKFIVELTGKVRPRALFIPTASGDPADYCDTFQRVYGRRLGCRTSALRLLADPDDRASLKEKILRAHLIYVGGGNTLRMMKLWRKLGVDKVLAKAARKGTVLCGLSAGAICWYQWGMSDSRSFSTPGKGWQYIRVKGLGFAPGLYCPHLDSEKRHKPLVAMLRRHRMNGFACEDQAALYHNGKTIRCVTANARARAYIYRYSRGRVAIDRFKNGEIVI